MMSFPGGSADETLVSLCDDVTAGSPGRCSGDAGNQAPAAGRTGLRITSEEVSSNVHLLPVDRRDSSSVADNLSVRTMSSVNKLWWKHPRVKDNCHLVVGSTLLTFLGTSLLITGVAVECLKNTAQDTGVHSYVFLVASALCLIPGLYHLIYIYCAVKGMRGFSFDNVPVLK